MTGYLNLSVSNSPSRLRWELDRTTATGYLRTLEGTAEAIAPDTISFAETITAEWGLPSAVSEPRWHPST